jgi:hypothetical protein
MTGYDQQASLLYHGIKGRALGLARKYTNRIEVTDYNEDSSL